MSTAQQVLAALGLTPRPDNYYRINSPLRPGSNSNSFALTITDDEHGTWYDHVSQERGSLYELIRKCPQWGIEPPGATIETSKRVYTDHVDYATQKGVPWEVFAAAGFAPARKSNRNAISIQTDHGTRYRFLDYRGGDTYINEKGFTACWYKLPEAIRIARETGAPLVYCNGEASTVVAQHFGVPAVTLAGGGERSITSTLIHELKTLWSGSVIVALDCDKAGRAAAAKVTKALNDEHIPAFSVDMQLGVGGDLADFVKLYNVDPMQHLQKLEPSTVVEKPTLQFDIITAADLENKRFRALNWTVEEILPEGAFLFAGKPKSRKSFAATHIARSVAMGKPVFGKYGVTEGRVLYLDLESNERRMQSRLRLMEVGQEGQSDKLHIATQWSKGPQAIEDLETFVAQYPDTVLIVVDILQNVRPPREKNADPYHEDYNTIQPFNVFAEKHHLSVLLIHHTRKMKSDDAYDEISGTTAMTGAVAGTMILSRLPGEENQTELYIRGRDIDSDDKRLLTWNDALHHHEVIGDIEAFLLTKERAQILEYLDDGMHYRASDIADMLGKSKQATHNLLKRLKASGHIKQDASTKYFLVKSPAPYVPVGYDTPAPAPIVAPRAFTVAQQARADDIQATVTCVVDMLPDNRVEEIRSLYILGHLTQAERIASAWIPTRPLLDRLREELLSNGK